MQTVTKKTIYVILASSGLAFVGNAVLTGVSKDKEDSEFALTALAALGVLTAAQFVVIRAIIK